VHADAAEGRYDTESSYDKKEQHGNWLIVVGVWVPAVALVLAR
jgi:hypothetical protein